MWFAEHQQDVARWEREGAMTNALAQRKKEIRGRNVPSGNSFAPTLESDFALWPWLAYLLLRFESPYTALWDSANVCLNNNSANETRRCTFFFRSFHHRYGDTYKPFQKEGRDISVLFTALKRLRSEFQHAQHFISNF